MARPLTHTDPLDPTRRALALEGYRLALALARRLAGRWGDEALSEAGWAAVRAAQTYDGSIPYLWHVRSVTRQRLYVLRHQRRPELLGYHDTDQVDEVSPGSDETLPAGLLEGLSEPERAVLEALYVRGQSYRDAAESLGVNTSTIVRRRERALANLRDHLPCP